MKHTPTYLMQKIQQSADPYAPVRQPSGFWYKSARWMRDLPMDNPAILAAGVALYPFGLPIHGALASVWAAASLYSTGKEVAAAIPSFARGLMRLGSRKHEFASPMVDTTAARSMRQASLRAIHDSGYMLRAVIGSEAKIMHS